MKKILFVCTANVCRSPMAEAIFNALAGDASSSSRAESAGVAALVGRGITSNAAAALAEVGVYPKEHRARQVDLAMVEDADLVLAMEPWHVTELRRLFGDPTDKVYTLPGYTAGVPGEEGIPDPYGLTMTAFRASARQLLQHVELLMGLLER